MLDIVFDDSFTIRRLSGQRDIHGKAVLTTVVEVDSSGNNTDVPLHVECFVDRRRRMSRSVAEQSKAVDATIYYNVSEAAVRLLDTDLLVLDSSDETFRVADIREQVSIVEGSEYVVVNVTRVKTPVTPNAASKDDV